MSEKIKIFLSAAVSNRFFLIGSITLFLFISFIHEADAQLAVSMQVNRKNYLLYEHVNAKVNFRNYTGRGLVFGNNKGLQGNLSFKILGPNGKVVKVMKKINPLKGIVLNPGATESVVVSLSDYFDLGKAGNYTVKAVISHPQLNSAYKSPKIGFTVFNGIPVWKREVGVPDVLNTNSHDKIKTRIVKILNFYTEKKKLYALMIEDKDLIYNVVRLTEDLDNDKPLVEIDGLSRIHIFTQIGEKVFSYFVYDINGNLENHTNYVVSNGIKPTLIRNAKEGTVMVIGGKKAVKGKDFESEDPNPKFNED